MSDPLLIYGATGYTGRLITTAAVALGLRPVLCGRNEAKLEASAAPLGLDYRVAAVAEPDRLSAALRGIEVVLHAAGPFSQTSRPMIDACLGAGTHYLDITGEIPVLEDLVRRHADARARRIMVMPAVGFDVVPSDCLAAHVARRLPAASRLAIGLSGLRFATRGSAKTLAEHAGYGVLVRRHGLITSVPPGSLSRAFDYGAGPRPSLNISWGDVSAAFYTTGIPNIEVYFEATPALRAMLMASRYLGGILATAPWQTWLKACANMLPEGDSEEERAAGAMVIVAEADDETGRRAAARLRTPEAYTFTGITAAAIARRVLQGDLEIGFQTPARLYGPDFVLSLAGVCREDLE
jgi:short subunit dehydrogenase-like uncharacterized protein